ncbi:hypothetical protein HGO38_13550 [Rhizobium sp. CG5]|uniref:hypothetical protein n=1 Tax=Rhizobium sp. CG5 TaxID=2726076 RepID=UPI002033F983|nr:hypothetical protein [Rhizobium sp. CG5]MCM2474501.1 hypothetical protein [Rhizobium sp. CG5]
MRYRLIFFIIGPFVLWSISFTTLYGVQGLGCRADWDTVLLAGFPLLRLVLMALLVLATALSAALYLAARSMDTHQPGMGRIARYSALAGMVSTVITFPGVFWLQLC